MKICRQNSWGKSEHSFLFLPDSRGDYGRVILIGNPNLHDLSEKRTLGEERLGDEQVPYFSVDFSPLVGRSLQLGTRQRRKFVKLPKAGIFRRRSLRLPVAGGSEKYLTTELTFLRDRTVPLTGRWEDREDNYFSAGCGLKEHLLFPPLAKRRHWSQKRCWPGPAAARVPGSISLCARSVLGDVQV